MFESDWDGTNHFELHDTSGDYFYWDIETLIAEHNEGGMLCDMPAHKLLGEMMDAWCALKNLEYAERG